MSSIVSIQTFSSGFILLVVEFLFKLTLFCILHVTLLAALLLFHYTSFYLSCTLMFSSGHNETYFPIPAFSDKFQTSD